ncbi:DNA-binding protein [Podospora conica]|nr:DNA-binding protein [Schizothecium conicum]
MTAPIPSQHQAQRASIPRVQVLKSHSQPLPPKPKYVDPEDTSLPQHLAPPPSSAPVRQHPKSRRHPRPRPPQPPRRRAPPYPPHPDGSTTLAQDQAYPLLSSFSCFLLASIHNLLYLRALYPRATFLSSRAYDLPVHQSRHPAVCAWIRSAVDAVTAQIARGAVARVAVVVHGPKPKREILERWLFDTSRFPAWPPSVVRRDPAKAMEDTGMMLEMEGEEEESRELQGLELLEPPEPWDVNWPDVDQQLRGALRRMAHAAEGMGELPAGCGFTVAVEMREEGMAPIEHPQSWIPSEPNLQPESSTREAGEDVGGVKTTPIRSVEAGPLFFECWVEETKAKFTVHKEAAAKLPEGEEAGAKLPEGEEAGTKLPGVEGAAETGASRPPKVRFFPADEETGTKPAGDEQAITKLTGEEGSMVMGGSRTKRVRFSLSGEEAGAKLVCEEAVAKPVGEEARAKPMGEEQVMETGTLEGPKLPGDEETVTMIGEEGDVEMGGSEV